MFCSNCGSFVADGASFCGNCGKKIEYTKTASSNDTLETESSSGNTNNTALSSNNQYSYPNNTNYNGGNSDKSKIAAGLLAIFLGALGIHKFYLGYTKEGVITLVITLVGSLLCGIGPVVMGIIALIEGIMYLTKSDDDFYRTYVANQKGWF